MRVTLNRLTDTCWSDLDVLLAGPTGNMILMSDVGDCGGGAEVNFSFDDIAA